MLAEWYFWVCSLRPDELLMVLGVLLLVDAPRYVYSVLGMAVWDILKSFRTGKLPGPGVNDHGYAPTVSETTWPLFAIPLLLLLVAGLILWRRLRAKT